MEAGKPVLKFSTVLLSGFRSEFVSTRQAHSASARSAAGTGIFFFHCYRGGDTGLSTSDHKQ